MGNLRNLSFLFPRLPAFSSRHFLSLDLHSSNISSKSDARRRADADELDTIDDARAVFDDMLQRNPLPSRYEFNRLFPALFRKKHLSTPQELDFSGIRHDLHSLTILLDCFYHSPCLGYTFSVLREMFMFGLQPNVNGLCLDGNAVESVELLNRMTSSGCQSNFIPYSTVVNGANGGAPKVLEMMEERGFHRNAVTYSTIIDSLWKGKLMAEVRNLLSGMIGKGIQRTVFTCNSLIHAMCSPDQPNEATNFQNEMMAKGVNPNGVTYKVLVDSLCKDGRVLEAQDIVIVEGMGKQEFKFDGFTCNGLIDGYCLKSEMHEARRVFNPLGYNRLAPTKLVNHNTLINGYSTLRMMAISGAQNLQLGHTHRLRLYHSGVAFSKKMRGKLSKTLKKQNILDHKRRLLAAKYEVRRKLHKAFCKDPDLPIDMRDKHRYKLSKLPRKGSFVRVRNRCIFTGRPRSVYEFFRMSRIVFRGLASQGRLMGIKKSSW